MNIKYKSGILLFLCLLVCFFISGCIPLGDNFYSIEGTVYEWVNAPVNSKSEVFHKEIKNNQIDVNVYIPENCIISPLSNASLKLAISGFEEQPSVSDTNGNFDIFLSGPPTREEVMISITVSAQGFQAVTRKFLDNDGIHRLKILLVRDSN